MRPDRLPQTNSNKFTTKLKVNSSIVEKHRQSRQLFVFNIPSNLDNIIIYEVVQLLELIDCKTDKS